MTTHTQTLRLAEVRLDGDTQARVEIDGATVEEYAERMLAGKQFPPLSVCFDGERYWLWDGFHRFHAARQAGMMEFPCEVRPGSLEDARWLSLATNAEHGKRRTNADKRHYVGLALDRRPELSDRAIAEHCGVSQTFVGKVRRERSTVNGLQSTARVGRDGRTIQTGNIGRRGAAFDEQVMTIAQGIVGSGRFLDGVRSRLTPDEFTGWMREEGLPEDVCQACLQAAEEVGPDVVVSDTTTAGRVIECIVNPGSTHTPL